MKNDCKNDFPLARKDGLVLRDLGDELLVYDRERDKAHCLNRSAAAVWQRCDGRSAPAQIAAALQQEFGTAVDERFVWLALEQIGRDHLLDQTLEWPKTVPRLSRREAFRRIGLGAAIALPVVISITAPTPAQAATCRASGSVCNTSSQCCSGICACPPAQTCPPSNMRCV
ncbi:MAG TPA: PqqD family protein [Pyrinomonadaceae bacterium]|jgi:hypothetical protein|nr:PqqD family protein [Pyrinomonadaceae bacterium]